jgi:hypothetical protein
MSDLNRIRFLLSNPLLTASDIVFFEHVIAAPAPETTQEPAPETTQEPGPKRPFSRAFCIKRMTTTPELSPQTTVEIETQ